MFLLEFVFFYTLTSVGIMPVCLFLFPMRSKIFWPMGALVGGNLFYLLVDLPCTTFVLVSYAVSKNNTAIMVVDRYKYSLDYTRNSKERLQCSRRSAFRCKAVYVADGHVIFGKHKLHNHDHWGSLELMLITWFNCIFCIRKSILKTLHYRYKWCINLLSSADRRPLLNIGLP